MMKRNQSRLRKERKEKESMGEFTEEQGAFSLFKNPSDIYREPHTEIDETEKEFIISVEMPGALKNGIVIQPTSYGIALKLKKEAR